MDRDTKVIIVLALIVLGVLYFIGGRNFSLSGTPNPAIAIQPTIPAAVDIAPIDPYATVQPELNTDLNADINITVDPIGEPEPLFSLDEPSSFFSGVIHGLLAPFMLVISLFLPNVRMYDFSNIGPTYDLGFLLGLVLLLAVTQLRRFVG